MIADSQVVYTVIYNITIAVLIVVLCFVFVSLVVVLDWLFTCVLDCFNIFSDCESRKQEKRNGQL
jgi:hypothetical protein